MAMVEGDHERDIKDENLGMKHHKNSKLNFYLNFLFCLKTKKTLNFPRISTP
jgi:hypothetical protein